MVAPTYVRSSSICRPLFLCIIGGVIPPPFSDHAPPLQPSRARVAACAVICFIHCASARVRVLQVIDLTSFPAEELAASVCHEQRHGRVQKRCDCRAGRCRLAVVSFFTRQSSHVACNIAHFPCHISHVTCHTSAVSLRPVSAQLSPSPLGLLGGWTEEMNWGDEWAGEGGWGCTREH